MIPGETKPMTSHTKNQRNEKTDTLATLAALAKANAQAVEARDASRRIAAKMRAVMQRSAELNTFRAERKQGKHGKDLAAWIAAAEKISAEKWRVFGKELRFNDDAAQAVRGGAIGGRYVETEDAPQIATTWKTGEVFSPALNPNHDAHQLAFEKRETVSENKIRETDRYRVRAAGGKYVTQTVTRQRVSVEKIQKDAPTYPNAIRAYAAKIASASCRRSRLKRDHLRLDMETEAASAAGEFFAKRIHKFPTLTEDLLTRFILGALPSSTSRNLAKACLRACDNRMGRMSGRTKLVDTKFFNVFSDRPGQDLGETEARAIKRIRYLRTKVNERASVNGNAARAARSHLALLDAAEAYALHCINSMDTQYRDGDGEKDRGVELPDSGLKRETKIAGTSRAVFIATKTSEAIRIVNTDTVEQTGEQVLTSKALWCRVSRLLAFVGE
jgi:hypothetical protein